MKAKTKAQQEIEAKFSSKFWQWVDKFEKTNKCIVMVNIEDLNISENLPPIGIIGKPRKK